MNRVLFLDDDQNIINGLKRMLRSLRDEMEFHFFTDSDEAISKINELNFDIIVSDMRMPKIEGSEFLKIVTKIQPNATRFILSGHADDELIIKSIGVSHQFLSKPCDAEVIISKFRKTIKLRESLEIKSFDEKILNSLEELKTLPQIYSNVKEKMEKDDSTIKDIAAIIYLDPLLTAQILKIVNSAYFGIPRNITDLETAITYLGINRLLSIILNLEFFTRVPDNLDQSNFDKIFNHCLELAGLAKMIASDLNLEFDQQNEVFIAANLHDIGKVILFNVYHNAYSDFINEDDETVQKELATFHTSHAKVGAYLLGLWGFNENIIEALTYHHDKEFFMNCPDRKPSKVLYLAHEIFNHHHSLPEYIVEYINTRDYQKLLPKWLERFND
jgi:putative nucleotidyltransferase with HDIG domain